jgi:zinc/manganese transport system substrate-binding protein
MNIVFNFRKPAVLRPVLVAPVLVLIAALTAGCSSAGSEARGHVSVVAATSVWGDVARQVAGRLAGTKVSVKAIISNPSADPHSYEVDPRDELAIKRADVIIENGGGYDDFMGKLRSAAGADGSVLDAVRISGKQPVHGDLNEHVWYDFPTVQRVAARIASVLAAKDPADAATFRGNAAAFGTSLRRLEAGTAVLRQRYGGTAVAITEPVPLYLLAACGLVNRTPEAFSSAVEDEQDVAVRVLQQTKQLFSQHRVRVLVYNAQTTGAQTGQVISAARAAGVPVVPVTETLPAGLGYLPWMAKNLDALTAALSGTSR